MFLVEFFSGEGESYIKVGWDRAWYADAEVKLVFVRSEGREFRSSSGVRKFLGVIRICT